jgi:hypothetical protein
MTTTPTVTELRPNGNPDCGCAELARYLVPTGERVLYRQCVDGDVQVIDVPAHGAGSCYLVERDLKQDGPGAVVALVADYLQQTRRLGAIPMASRLAMAA